MTIKGSYLNGVTKVAFNRAKATSISKDTAAKVKVKVPIGATSGKIKLVTPDGKVKSVGIFTAT